MTSVRLTAKQAEIVEARDGAILVEAGPGSGKTRVLTERIRRLIQSSEGKYRVLALTFTNKAADEMRSRLETTISDVNDHVYIGTIHSFCLQVLTERGKSVGVEGGPTIFDALDDRKRVMRDAKDQDPLLQQEIGRRARSVEDEERILKNWLKEISETKRKLLLPAQVRRADPVLAAAYEGYDLQLKKSRALDFDDLLLLTYRLLTERPEIAAFYRRLYRYVCIDEAQDLNEAQYKLLKALCGPDFKNVMLVGDPHQNIYAWNGSHHKYLEQFAREFSAQKFQLVENFRSAKRITKAASKLATLASTPSEAVTPAEGEIRAFSLPDEAAEAEFVIANAKRIIEEGHTEIEERTTWGSVAILARTAYLLSPVEEVLKQQGLPYYKRISAEDVYQSDTLREFELLLRLVANPRDHLHYDLLLESWKAADNAGPVTDETGKIEMPTLVHRLSSLPPRAGVEWRAVEAIGDAESDFDLLPALEELTTHAADLPEEDKAAVLADINSLRGQWRAFLKAGPAGKRRLVSFLAHTALGGGQPIDEEGLALLTVHSAKGLEFDAVFLVGFAQGTFPDYRAQTEALVEEEQRNAYVAITRARRVCYITYPRERLMPWGDKRTQQPSVFLELMGLKPIARTKA
ncbi:MAG: ATP-dependent helicase [Candidatus Thermoplasmatota archaeon]